MRRRATLLTRGPAWLATVVLVAAACTSVATHAAPDRASAAIGRTGGHLTLRNGVRVDVPPGALPIQRTLKLSTTKLAVPSQYRQVGPAILVAPDDFVFKRPVTVRIPLTTMVAPSKNAALFAMSVSRDARGFLLYSVDPSTYDAKTRVLTAQAPHFSQMVPVLFTVKDAVKNWAGIVLGCTRSARICTTLQRPTANRPARRGMWARRLASPNKFGLASRKTPTKPTTSKSSATASIRNDCTCAIARSTTSQLARTTTHFSTP